MSYFHVIREVYKWTTVRGWDVVIKLLITSENIINEYRAFPRYQTCLRAYIS